MNIPPPAEHFQGKSVVEHLKTARTKGSSATEEPHGAEMPGHLGAFADAAKETTLALLVLWTLLTQLQVGAHRSMLILALFTSAWVLWKAGRSASLGWARLERLHRLIEEERWEIQHHRHQEREELGELYKAKGFSGKLLEEVLDVLMADDNRLLQVMLEEELGLTLGVYEHPLKQAAGAALGVLGAFAMLGIGFLTNPSWGIPLAACAILIGAATMTARLERSRALPAAIWALALAAVSTAVVYFATETLVSRLLP